MRSDQADRTLAGDHSCGRGRRLRVRVRRGGLLRPHQPYRFLCGHQGEMPDQMREPRSRGARLCTVRKIKPRGWSEGFADLSQAQQKALDNCSVRGAACKLGSRYNNSCGALAADGDIVTFGTADVRANADQRAPSRMQEGRWQEVRRRSFAVFAVDYSGQEKISLTERSAGGNENP